MLNCKRTHLMHRRTLCALYIPFFPFLLLACVSAALPCSLSRSSGEYMPASHNAGNATSVSSRTTVVYSCPDEWHFLVGEATQTCAEGRWSATQQPQCKRRLRSHLNKSVYPSLHYFLSACFSYLITCCLVYTEDVLYFRKSGVQRFVVSGFSLLLQ